MEHLSDDEFLYSFSREEINKNMIYTISAILFNIKLMIPVVGYKKEFKNERLHKILFKRGVISELGSFSRELIGDVDIVYPDYYTKGYEDSEAYFASKMPRIHPAAKGDLVNKGFGNCLYALGAVSDFRNKYSKNINYKDAGISSYDGNTQSKFSKDWWKKAVKHGIALKNDRVYSASLESFITAGWIPLLIKPDRKITRTEDIKKEDTEYVAFELFDDINRNNMDKKSIKNFNILLKNLLK